ncbi:M48 family metallopeptidase [Wenzhouxiangella sp. AB-CW3]|uniref:M48 family metalloprotease n=1 Tax=Wenzhouxiangella sp. AB-CW3 TaxID=2771012 RepID=UPI00168B1C19|nr:M48 family metalloprotease [Wenzhouxiangella sp. AB-CW3]QOC23584.1 M48 family metallopeptidase [Wenzhouxiangella sp. AB-CW3]
MKKLFSKLTLMVGIVSLAGLVAAQSVQLPDMGGTSTRVLPPDAERTFPKDMERFLRASRVLIEDPMIRGFFEDMGFRLVAQSSRPSAHFHFFVINDPTINAFAAPAGVIGLHTGLILTAHDESEVAGVVAHEIAHITQDHLARGMEQAQQVSLPTMLATLGLALAAGAAGAGADAGQAILMSGMGLAQQFQINHTRQAEAEADRIGIGLLARSGYDPHGMTRFFERLNSVSRAMGQGPPEYLRTHPLTVNRIAEARDRAVSLKERELREPRDGEAFHFVQARLRALISQRPEQAEQFFKARLQDGTRPEQAMRYGLALTYVRERRLDEAAEQIEYLHSKDPDRQIYRLLEADWLLASDQIDDSLKLLESLYNRYPGSRMVTTQYAEALMHEREPERAARAADVLRRHLRRHPDDLPMTELLARAADRAGEPVRATEALAESYYMRGGVYEAIEQLERLIQRDDLDYYQRARITARIDELRAEQVRLGNAGRRR